MLVEDACHLRTDVEEEGWMEVDGLDEAPGGGLHLVPLTGGLTRGAGNWRMRTVPVTNL